MSQINASSFLVHLHGASVVAVSPKWCASAWRQRNPHHRFRFRKALRPWQGPTTVYATSGESVQATDIAHVDMPSLDYNLHWYQEADGARFSSEGVPETFQNDEDAMFTWQNGTVLTDRSHWGRLRVTGQDRLRFLHSQSTADIAGSLPGQVVDAVVTTSKGRMLDLVTCVIQPSSVLLLTSPQTSGTLSELLQRYILYGDRVEIADVSANTALFTLAGPTARQTLTSMGGGPLMHLKEGEHGLMQCSGRPVVVCAGSQMASLDFTLIVDEGVAAELWHSLTSKGAVPMGMQAWQDASVMVGRPIHGLTLTEQHNPLEAGLYGAVSLAKGCYMGQEALARAHIKGLAKSLWGLRAQQPSSLPPSLGDVVYRDGQEVGMISAVARRSQDTAWIANGYLRCRFKGEQSPMHGQQVSVNGVTATITELPYLQRAFREGQAPAATAIVSEEALPARGLTKEERLEQMQQRLAAWENPAKTDVES